MKSQPGTTHPISSTATAHTSESVAVTHANEPMTSPLIQVSGALLGIIVLILAAAWVVKRVMPGAIKAAP